MLTDTRLESWQRLQPTLTERQGDVYFVIQSKGGATALECAQFLHLPLHCVSGRVTELRNQGLIIDRGKRAYNPVTHRNLVVWEPVDR